MHITWVIPTPDLSGGIKVVGIYAERLLARGHTVHVVYPLASWPRPWRVRSFGRRLIKQLRYGSADLTHLANLPSENVIVCPGQREVLEAHVPDGDVVIATWWKTACWVHALSPSKGRKVHFVQGYEVMSSPVPGDVDRALQLPLGKITISGWLQDKIRTLCGTAAALVPNGVDLAQFHAPERSVQTPPVVGFLYSSSWWKGPDVVCEAIRLARQTIPDLKAVAFGAVRPGSGLPSGCEFVYRPPQDRIRDIYSRCDVWLCGSRSEGFHLPPLEAMACRCPVVSTRVGGPMDCIEEAVNGYLVDIDDAAGLANRLVTILSNPQRLQKMSLAAHETSLRFCWDASTAKLEGLLRETP